MGGVVSGIGDVVGDVVGGVGGIASSVAGAVPGIGPVLGPVVGGITGGPVGFATSLAGQALQGNYGGGGGGGGSSGSTNPTTPAYVPPTYSYSGTGGGAAGVGGSAGSNIPAPMYAKPEYNYGNQTYQYGNNPVDASKYFVTGDRGVYNLMPALGQIAPKTLQSTNPMYTDRMAAEANNKSYFTPYEAYNDLSAKMAQDPKALAAFQSMYKPTTPTGQGVSPYVDFGLGSSIGSNQTYADVAKYAATNQNPFYMPYKGTAGGGTEMSTYTAPLNQVGLRQQKLQAMEQKLQAMNPYDRAVEQAKMTTLKNDLMNGNYAPHMSNLLSAFRPKPTPTPVRPTTPTPTTPTPVRPPSYPGITTTPYTPPRMAQGGIAMLRRPQ
jgi:hypothetical protein